MTFRVVFCGEHDGFEVFPEGMVDWFMPTRLADDEVENAEELEAVDSEPA